ncbi:hypothetical protein B9Z55_007702 [Caenorhabditis nigoni]|uniref:BTB domain-containing protein n=2 Tax=Caenorhabditis nigoni TaxID=1611254 RepID=A0A2G5VAW0_9PELO|nr:hypothetical protein B9Z55_007702 [Caenorhabditis nigoni]
MLTIIFSVVQMLRETASNESDKNEKELETELIPEDAQVLQKVDGKIDELSDRLKSIEESISKLSKSNDDSEIDESAPTTNLTIPESKKKSKLQHVFRNVSNFENGVHYFSEWQDYFNVKWRMSVLHHNGHLGIFVFCQPIVPTDQWSIRMKLEFKVIDPTGNVVSRTWERCYGSNDGWGFSKFLEWEDMEEWHLVNGNLIVEVHGEIVETTGMRKEKVRKFDESQKDVSDVIIVVRDTKFYVSKMFLASQSSVFKALLLGNFSESNQSEVTLNGIDPDDFHYFLEVLYGESAIDDTNVEGVALLADMYGAPTAIRKCEEFLLKESKMTLEKKLKIATRYNLERLRALESLVDHSMY